MNKKDRVWIFLQKMNEQLQYAWNFQLSMLSLKNGFHSHLLPLVHPHQRFTPISKLATNTTETTTTTATKKKKKSKIRTSMLNLKKKENKRVLLENWRSAKHEEWWIYPSFFFFLLSLSLSLWVSFSHTTPSATSQIHIIIVLQICFLSLFTKSRGGSKASSDFKK